MQRNDELVQRLTTMFGIFETGDISSFDRLVSRETEILGIGTDPDEWWWAVRRSR